MKLLDRQPKQGLIQVIIETADDLWYLHTIVDAGDRCSGDSEYKYKLGDGHDAKAQIVKKKVWVTLSVEKTEFTGATGQLRITGKVVDGSEEVPRGSYHSLDITEGSRLTIIKDRWLEYQAEKLDEALSATKMGTLLVLFDREQALFATLKPNGYEILLTLKGDVPKKGVDEGKQHSFYRDIVKHLEDYQHRMGLEHIIAASPSFWKEYLEKELTPPLRGKTLFTTISAVDETAVHEVLRRPELQQALRLQRTTRELHLVEAIMTALAKDKLVYGIVDVKAAIAEGNVSEITVSEHAIVKAKEEETFAELETVLRAASDIKTKVHLLSTPDAAGKIDGLGGIVGIKRW